MMWKRYSVYKIRKVNEHIFLIRNCDVNMVLIKGNQRMILFDTGYGFADIDSLIRKISGLPYDVILSHGHLDHIGGANQFPSVFLHEKDFETANKHSQKDFRRISIANAQKYGRIPFEKMIQAHSSTVYPRKVLDDYIDVAEHPDWEKGKVRKPSLSSGPDVVIRTVMSRHHAKLSAKLVIEESRLYC